MKLAILSLVLCPCLSAAETTEPARETTDADLQNLVACSRMALGNLTPEQISAVAVAIKHAETDITNIRKAAAVPVKIDEPKEEPKKEAKKK